MEMKRITAATRNMGQDQAQYTTLAIRDVLVPYDLCDGRGLRPVPMMLCCFEPTPDELEKLNRGELVYLSILGVNFPPVNLHVGDPHPVSDGNE